MSRIHAVIIAVLVTAAVAFGVTTAFEATARIEAVPTIEESTSDLQARALRINQEEQRLAKLLRDNPEVDRSPITKVIRVPRPARAQSVSASRSGGTGAVARHDDDDEREYDDDHHDDRGDDDGDDD